MASRVTRSRSRVATTSDIDDLSSTLSSHINHNIEQLVTDAANNKAKQTQVREQDADTDANLSELTKADLVEMIKVQKDMLRDTILALTANFASTAPTELSIQTVARKMIDPAKFYGGAQDLNRFLSQLKHRFNIESHQFQDRADQVDYAISLLGKWSGYTDAELCKTQMTNPDEWGTSLVTVSSPCLASFKLFEAEIRRMYGDKDCRLSVVIKAAGEYQQGHTDPNETVRSYANQIRTNW